MARFASTLANAGFEVWVPYIDDYLALRLTPQAIVNFNRVVSAALEGRLDVSLFSISFGSLLALRAASAPELSERLSGAVLFGGFADLSETMRFCLTGEVEGIQLARHDPLNRPILLMNVLEHLEHGLSESEEAKLIEAWRKYMRSTWGREEMRQGERYFNVAREIRSELPTSVQSLFDTGVGLEGCDWEMLERGLKVGDYAYLDPREYLQSIHCPVHLVHGVDDDVIPFTQSERLHRLLQPHTDSTLYLTGLYGHTAKANVSGGVVNEILTLGRLLKAIASGGA